MTNISHLSTDARKLPDTYAGFVGALKKSGEAILATMTPQGADLTHMAIGLSGECAELLEPFLSVRLGNPQKLIDRVNIVEELGDIEFFLEGIYHNIGVERPYWAGSVVDESRMLIMEQMVVMSGNILDTVKRWTIYGKPLALENLIDQLNVFEAHLISLYSVLDITRDEVINHNVNKLATRYASLSYSDAQAQNRADKA